MKSASFVELVARDNVDPADLIATLRNYAEDGAGISAWVVRSIIERTPLSQEHISHMLESAQIGYNDQLRRGFENDAAAYAATATFLATVMPTGSPSPNR